MGAAAATGVTSVNLSINPVTPKVNGQLEFIYYPMWCRAPGAALALEHAGLDYKFTSVIEEWGALKPTTPWRTIPILKVPGYGTIGPEKTILNYIGQVVPSMAGTTTKDFLASQQTLWGGDDILVRLLEVQPHVLEPTKGPGKEKLDDLWANEDVTRHCTQYGFGCYLVLLEEFYQNNKAAEGKFTSSGTTIGECKCFASLHTLVMVKPDVLAKYPGLKKFYDTFMAHPVTKKFMTEKHSNPQVPAPGTFAQFFIPLADK